MPGRTFICVRSFLLRASAALPARPLPSSWIQAKERHRGPFFFFWSTGTEGVFLSFPTDEAGGVAFHSQANTLAIPPSNGHHLTLEDVEDNIIRGDDIHSAPTRIVALENTLSGTVFPQEEVRFVSTATSPSVVVELGTHNLFLFRFVTLVDRADLGQDACGGSDYAL